MKVLETRLFDQVSGGFDWIEFTSCTVLSATAGVGIGVLFSTLALHKGMTGALIGAGVGLLVGGASGAGVYSLVQSATLEIDEKSSSNNSSAIMVGYLDENMI